MFLTNEHMKICIIMQKTSLKFYFYTQFMQKIFSRFGCFFDKKYNKIHIKN